MHYLSTRIHFSAYHRLWNPAFSETKNEEIYQECIRGHGHNYILEVTIQGNTDPHTGMVMDLKKLKHLLKKEVFHFVDHKNLNEDVFFLKGIIPTAENLATVFWQLLKPKITDAKLYRIRLLESENNIAEYYGPEHLSFG
ncbi:MAG: 6-carboxytetrahydropterin synthase [Deltaproteobacteria bacterium]|nr:6-carboxytetrahydropterin synthase [Deltaproteobacteria bacterium]